MLWLSLMHGLHNNAVQVRHNRSGTTGPAGRQEPYHILDWSGIAIPVFQGILDKIQKHFLVTIGPKCHLRWSKFPKFQGGVWEGSLTVATGSLCSLPDHY